MNEGTEFGDGYAGGGGTPFLKCRGGRQIVSAKLGGRVGKKERETKVFCGGNEKHSF